MRATALAIGVLSLQGATGTGGDGETLREAARAGQVARVRSLLDAGVAAGQPRDGTA